MNYVGTSRSHQAMSSHSDSAGGKKAVKGTYPVFNSRVGGGVATALTDVNVQSIDLVLHRALLDRA